MSICSLDQIVRNMLLKKRYSLAWYLDFLLYAAECLKILTLDDLNVVNTKLVTVNTDGLTIDIPPDCSAVVGVYVEIGQRLHPLVEDNSLNPIPNYSSNFQSINPYINYTQNNGGFFDSYVYPSMYAMTTVDFYGESTGRRFGWAGGSGNDTYKVIKARGVIQLNDYIQNTGVTNVVLCYVGDGRNADAASHVDILCDDAIKSYINWQMAENSRTYSTSDKERLRQLWIQERIILRARLSDLSIAKMTRIIQKNSVASPR